MPEQVNNLAQLSKTHKDWLPHECFLVVLTSYNVSKVAKMYGVEESVVKDILQKGFETNHVSYMCLNNPRYLEV